MPRKAATALAVAGLWCWPALCVPPPPGCNPAQIIAGVSGTYAGAALVSPCTAGTAVAVGGSCDIDVGSDFACPRFDCVQPGAAPVQWSPDPAAAVCLEKGCKMSAVSYHSSFDSHTKVLDTTSSAAGCAPPSGTAAAQNPNVIPNNSTCEWYGTGIECSFVQCANSSWVYAGPSDTQVQCWPNLCGVDDYLSALQTNFEDPAAVISGEQGCTAGTNATYGTWCKVTMTKCTDGAVSAGPCVCQMSFCSEEGWFPKPEFGQLKCLQEGCAVRDVQRPVGVPASAEITFSSATGCARPVWGDETHPEVVANRDECDVTVPYYTCQEVQCNNGAWSPAAPDCTYTGPAPTASPQPPSCGDSTYYTVTSPLVQSVTGTNKAEVAKAFDQSTSTSWSGAVGASPWKIGLEFHGPQTVAGYRVIAKDFPPGDSPQSWRVLCDNTMVHQVAAATWYNVTDWDPAGSPVYQHCVTGCNYWTCTKVELEVTANTGTTAAVTVLTFLPPAQHCLAGSPTAAPLQTCDSDNNIAPLGNITADPAPFAVGSQSEYLIDNDQNTIWKKSGPLGASVQMRLEFQAKTRINGYAIIPEDPNGDRPINFTFWCGAKSWTEVNTQYPVGAGLPYGEAVKCANSCGFTCKRVRLDITGWGGAGPGIREFKVLQPDTSTCGDPPTWVPTRAPSGTPTTPPTLPPSQPPTAAPSGPPSLPPTAAPSAPPSKAPSGQPSAGPSRSPTRSPSKAPSGRPSAGPSLSPSLPPSVPPSLSPSVPPSVPPSSVPSKQPSASPLRPSTSPSAAPTRQPVLPPTLPPIPQGAPSHSPARPTTSPTRGPSASPARAPTANPTRSPSASPQKGPTAAPTVSPSAPPSVSPAQQPSASPTRAPSRGPVVPPTMGPIAAGAPSQSPAAPTVPPTRSPSTPPSASPSTPPSASPSTPPTRSPRSAPTRGPSVQPTRQPSAAPSVAPSSPAPTKSPSVPPSRSPAAAPTRGPTRGPAAAPTTRPSVGPSQSPRAAPTRGPKPAPSRAPQRQPTASPFALPPRLPSRAPSQSPSRPPSRPPSAAPSPPPSASPRALPSRAPSQAPSRATSPPSLSPQLPATLAVQWSSPDPARMRKEPQTIAVLTLTGDARFRAQSASAALKGTLGAVEYDWAGTYEGFAAYIAAGGEVTTQLSSGGQRMEVRAGGADFRLRSPHQEVLRLNLTDAFFETAAAHAAVCSGRDPPCGGLLLGTLTGEPTVAASEAQVEAQQQGETAAVATAASVTVVAAVGGGGTSAANVARLSMVQSVLDCPQPSDTPTQMPMSLNPLQLSFGGSSDPARYAHGTVVGNTILFAFSALFCGCALLNEENRWRQRRRRLAQQGKRVPKHSLKSMMVRARIGWLIVPMSFLFGGVAVGCLVTMFRGAPTFYALATANLLLFCVALLYYVAKAAHTAPTYSSWRELPRAERNTGLKWIIWGDSEWIPKPDNHKTYKLLELHHLVFDGYRSGVPRYTMALEFLYTFVLAALSVWMPKTTEECRVQASLLAAVPFMWAAYLIAYRPYIAPYENVLDCLIALGEGTMMVILTSGLFAGPESWHDGAIADLGIAVVWTITLKSVLDLLVFVIDEHVLWREHTGGAGGTCAFVRWAACCQGQPTRYCTHQCFTCRDTLGKEDDMASSDSDGPLDPASRRFLRQDGVAIGSDVELTEERAPSGTTRSRTPPHISAELVSSPDMEVSATFTQDADSPRGSGWRMHHARLTVSGESRRLSESLGRTVQQDSAVRPESPRSPGGKGRYLGLTDSFGDSGRDRRRSSLAAKRRARSPMQVRRRSSVEDVGSSSVRSPRRRSSVDNASGRPRSATPTLPRLTSTDPTSPVHSEVMRLRGRLRLSSGEGSPAAGRGVGYSAQAKPPRRRPDTGVSARGVL